MIAFFTANLASILVGAAILAVLVLAFIYTLRQQKKGGTCGCVCEGCPSAGQCHPGGTDGK